ncbi:hypothetical protein [Caldisalinibacter kiritimatiensis]|uniref:Lipoprotein n=1 Tax=Caldisalinibacter kiritimatiensis TaxID=1304284 RepID=R1AX19_9FIRM|nr:hypothetical protein [Caldisalinibacter kiritimatiensis]EOD01753.1 hypothetical protein L21TH_0170 [Caldisalinibacter kiritimatiensis]
MVFKKNLSVLLVLIVIVFLVTACDNTVQQELINYYDKELSKISKLEEEAIDAYHSVIGDNYVDDYTLYNELEEVIIPKYGEFVNELKNISFTTKEVNKLNQIYIKAAEKQYNAFMQMKQAIEKQDKSLVMKANENLENARKLLKDWERELERLAEENKIKFQ